MVNLAISVNPARIAVGGGLVQSWERLRPGLEQALKAGTPFPPELVTARFPADAPLIGAVALAADAAGADISLDDRQLTPTTTPDPARPAPQTTPHTQITSGRSTARADGAIDGAPVTQHSHPQTERLQS